MWGDPHIETFDDVLIDLMEYEQTYHMVNHPDFKIKIETSSGFFREGDPRAQFSNFIVEIGNIVFTTKSNTVSYTVNGGASQQMPGLSNEYIAVY